jgi:hypothetical protein
VRFEALRDDPLNLCRFDHPHIQLPVGEKKQTAGRAFRSALELVASEHPPAAEVGAPAGFDLIDEIEDGGVIGHRLKGMNGQGLIIENGEGEEVVVAEVLHHHAGGLFGGLERGTVHAAGAVEDEAEGNRATACARQVRSPQTEGEVNGVNRICEDGVVFEVGFNLHAATLSARVGHWWSEGMKPAKKMRKAVGP